MQESIIHFFSSYPPHWSVFIMAMIPITELRVSIPIGITMFHMSPLIAFFWSVLGNIAVGAITLLILEPLIRYYIHHIPMLERFWNRYIDSIRRKHQKSFDRWGGLALIIFVGIPLPMTGVISGAIAASIFQIPFWHALPLLSAGSLLAGIIVTLITIGIF